MPEPHPHMSCNMERRNKPPFRRCVKDVLDRDISSFGPKNPIVVFTGRSSDLASSLPFTFSAFRPMVHKRKLSFTAAVLSEIRTPFPYSSAQFADTCKYPFILFSWILYQIKESLAIVKIAWPPQSFFHRAISFCPCSPRVGQYDFAIGGNGTAVVGLHQTTAMHRLRHAARLTGRGSDGKHSAILRSFTAR